MYTYIGDKMKVKVGVSNRHVHLKESDINILFGSPLTKFKDLTQPNNYASNNFVTIKTDKDIIEHVRVIGPSRNYTQIEISKTDAYKLGLNPPVRTSGNLKESEVVTLIGPNGSITTNGCIIADRHIHITKMDKIKYNLPDKVNVKINGIKKGIIEVNLKVSDEAFFELHIDDANAFMLKNGDEVEII
jgi:putative phosphotransacetylase